MAIRSFYFFLFGIFVIINIAYSQYVRSFRFSTEQQRRNYYEIDDWISYLPSNRPISAAIGDNYIYFGTQDGGILRYHLYENYWDYPFTTSNGLPSNTILDLAFDQDRGYLWARTPKGIAYFDPTGEIWTLQTSVNRQIFRWPSHNSTTSSTKLEKNHFYDRKFLNRLPTFFANGEYTINGEWYVMDSFFREYPIVGFIIDNQERIWFLVDGLGVGKGSMFTQRVDFIRVGLPQISPRVIEYQKNDLWIGGIRTSEEAAGIVRWRNDNGNWEYYQAGWIRRLFDDNVHAIETDGDSLWFGTEFGVTLYNLRKDQWRNFNVAQGLISNFVNDLEILGSFLYVATNRGMSRIDRSTGKVKKIRNARLFAISVNKLAHQGDTLWAATNRGIYRLLSKKNTWQFVPTTAILQDSVITAVSTFGKEVWFASSSNIMKLDISTNKWEDFPQIGFEVLGPYRDIKVNEKSVWVATRQGILKYDKQRKYWRLFTVMDGLPDNRSYYILLDGPYLWVATYKGITQFYWDNPARLD